MGLFLIFYSSGIKPKQAMVKSLIKGSLILIFLGLVTVNILFDWPRVSNNLVNLNPYSFTFFLLVLLLVYPEGAFSWYQILKVSKIPINFSKVMRIWVVSNTGRYIPGAIWQYLGRVELMKREQGVGRLQTIASMMLEAFLTILAAIVLGFLTLFTNPEKLEIQVWYLLILLPLVALHPSIANRVLKLMAKFTNREIGRFELNLTFRDTFSVFPWFIINFLINGLALFFLVSSITQTFDLQQTLRFVSIYSLSWIIGYLSVFAPAGLGVTEVTLAYLLSLSMPLSIASAIALIYRFFLTVSELIIFLLVIKIKKFYYE